MLQQQIEISEDLERVSEQAKYSSKEHPWDMGMKITSVVNCSNLW